MTELLGVPAERACSFRGVEEEPCQAKQKTRHLVARF